MRALGDPHSIRRQASSLRFSLQPMRVAKRLARGEIWYAIGRFSHVRRAYSGVRGLLQRVAGRSTGEHYRTSLFPDFPVAEAVATLRRDGVFCGLRLPRDTLAEINAFAERQPIVALQGGPPLSKREVRGGRLPSGEPAVVARVLDPESCPAVHRVVHDPALLSLARSYLGYQPSITRTQLHWSFVSDASADYRRELGQTVDYHFDVAWFNFLYVFFYLTDVDLRSGAHAIIRRSHLRKPLSMLWHSARQPDEAVLRRYGAASELTIEGEAGFGFAEDTSCFHKALVPITRERLAFFIHYT